MVKFVLEREGSLKEDRIGGLLAESFQDGRFNAGKVLFVVPDATRSCPLPFLFRTVVSELSSRVDKLTFLVALGTHPVPEDGELWGWFGLSPGERKSRYGHVDIVPHRWEKPETFRSIGTFQAGRISRLTGGRFSNEVKVAVNRLVFEHDLVVLLGPVFPHEVVGFSGGHKYLFPGIGQAEFINFFHWFGAVITNPRINGNRDTPVRALVEEAAGFLEVPLYGISLVTREDEIKAVFCGDVFEAWKRACEVSTGLHIVNEPHPYNSVLSCAPPMYNDMWVAAKCMYKLEGVVAGGGELIVYAPHVTEISYSHGELLDEVGYHVRDYFLEQWDRFKGYPWAILAHSTHLRGIGKYDNGVEKPRIKVTLATGIPEERCRKVNLGYRDPASIDPEKWRNSEDRLYVPHAGETLHRLSPPPPWARP